MSRVLNALVDDVGVRGELLRACTKVGEAVRQLPPIVSATDVANQLAAMGAQRMNWAQQDDVELRRRLRQLASEIDRMRRLKRGGIGAYDGSLGDEMRALLERLRQHGLFLVPVGELEEWLGNRDVGISKSDKRAWSNAAAQRIQKLGRQEGDVWEFVMAVGRHLSSGRSAAQRGVEPDGPSAGGLTP